MRRRGFTLLEMIIVLGLIAFVGLIATQLFRATLRVWRESASTQAAQSRFDQSIGQLRRDVWSASSIEVRDARSIRLVTSDHPIEWKADDPAGITRSSDQQAGDRHWSGIGKLTFEARGPALVVRVTSDQQEAGGQIVLMSQSMVLAGRSP